jgi:hypothetical protein
MIMNIICVLVEFLFAIVGSLVDSKEFIDVPGDARYSIAAVWTYLLPLVVGWLHVGSQPQAGHLRDALNIAHDHARVATPQPANVDTAPEPLPAKEITGLSACAIESSTKLINYINTDERKTAPIFNYARVFIWSQYAEYILELYRHAAAKVKESIPVHGPNR